MLKHRSVLFLPLWRSAHFPSEMAFFPPPCQPHASTADSFDSPSTHRDKFWQVLTQLSTHRERTLCWWCVTFDELATIPHVTGPHFEAQWQSVLLLDVSRFPKSPIAFFKLASPQKAAHLLEQTAFFRLAKAFAEFSTVCRWSDLKVCLFPPPRGRSVLQLRLRQARRLWRPVSAPQQAL